MPDPDPDPMDETHVHRRLLKKTVKGHREGTLSMHSQRGNEGVGKRTFVNGQVKL